MVFVKFLLVLLHPAKVVASTVGLSVATVVFLGAVDVVDSVPLLDVFTVVV